MVCPNADRPPSTADPRDRPTGKGELGIEAPVTTGDEYGRVAEAFNDMSRQLKQAEDTVNFGGRRRP